MRPIFCVRRKSGTSPSTSAVSVLAVMVGRWRTLNSKIALLLGPTSKRTVLLQCDSRRLGVATEPSPQEPSPSGSELSRNRKKLQSGRREHAIHWLDGGNNVIGYL